MKVDDKSKHFSQIQLYTLVFIHLRFVDSVPDKRTIRQGK